MSPTVGGVNTKRVGPVQLQAVESASIPRTSSSHCHCPPPAPAACAPGQLCPDTPPLPHPLPRRLTLPQARSIELRAGKAEIRSAPPIFSFLFCFVGDHSRADPDLGKRRLISKDGKTSSCTFFLFFFPSFCLVFPAVGVSVRSISLLFSVKDFYYINYIIINRKTVLCCKEDIVLDLLQN